MTDTVWVVIGEPYNEDVISCTVFKHKEDAENYMVATSSEEPYISLDCKEFIVNEKFPKDKNHDT
jgi:hypothetical protein